MRFAILSVFLLGACAERAPVVVSPPAINVPDRLLRCPTEKPILPERVELQSEFAIAAVQVEKWGEGCAQHLERVRQILRAQ